MEWKVRMVAISGILAILSTGTALLATGCESSNRVVAAEPSSTCPICERVTRVQPLTGLEYTTCICPMCEKVYTLDQQTLDAIERFTGPNIGDRVVVRDSCGAIIENCAVCRAEAIGTHRQVSSEAP